MKRCVGRVCDKQYASEEKDMFKIIALETHAGGQYKPCLRKEL
jgi:hypothetical protein